MHLVGLTRHSSHNHVQAPHGAECICCSVSPCNPQETSPS